MYNSEMSHSVGNHDSELSCRISPTESFRGMVTEEVAFTGMFALGCHERYQLLEIFLYFELGDKYKHIHM